MKRGSVRVRVWGDFACWTRPENKVERVSYECMTPSAARNILDAICWKPQMRWVVTGIQILKPIRFQSIRRLELQTRISPSSVSRWMGNPILFHPQVSGTRAGGNGTLRNTLALRDVSYVIEAFPLVYQPTFEDTPEKYVAMLNRRVQKGQCFHRPSLGLREFPADFELAGDTTSPIEKSFPLGRMLYDIIFSQDGRNNRAIFFDASVERGRLDTHPEHAFPDANTRKEILACSSRH